MLGGDAVCNRPRNPIKDLTGSGLESMALEEHNVNYVSYSAMSGSSDS